MRQGQQNRRGRGRGRKPQNPLTRNMESNGPDVKIRGTAAHIAEKYASLARDALSSGDTVAGESYLQHAEHYNRIIMANQAQQAESANGSGAGREQQPEVGSSDNKEPARASKSNGADEDANKEGLLRAMGRSDPSELNGAKEAASEGDDAGDESDQPEQNEKGSDEAADEAVT